MGIGPGQVVLSHNAYDELRDALYRLEAAGEDAIIDAQDTSSVENLQKIINRLGASISSTTKSLPEPSAES